MFSVIGPSEGRDLGRVLVVRHRADEALGRVDVVQPDHWRRRPRYQVVAGGMEWHAGDGGCVCYGLEGFLGRCFTVVEHFNGEIIGSWRQNRFFGVKF